MENPKPIIDRSAFDKKYFDSRGTFNCPYCNRNHIPIVVAGEYTFDWSREKKCHSYLVQCQACFKISLHHSWTKLKFVRISAGLNQHMFLSGEDSDDDWDLDEKIFHSIPSSFFVQDHRIPKILREIVSEADSCLKMNFLTGASACVRKAIYEFTVWEEAVGDDYDKRIKFLKSKFSNVDKDHFDVLCHIKDMTSDKVHEQSWDKWDAKHIQLFLEVLRTIFHEIYVAPKEKEARSAAVSALLGDVKKDKKSVLNQTSHPDQTK